MSSYQWVVATDAEREVWGKEIWLEAEKKDPMQKYMGSGWDSIINVRDEIKMHEGKQVTYEFLVDLSGGGLTASDTLASGLAAYATATGLAGSSSYGADAMGGISDMDSTFGKKTAFSADAAGYGKLIGREEPVTILTDTMTVAEKRHGVRKTDDWLDQLMMDRHREKSKTLLGRWMANYRKLSIIKHLCGVSTWQFPSAALAPTTHTTYELNRHLFGGNATAADELTEGCYFTTEEIDRMIELAKVACPKINPYTTEDGEELHVIWLHTYQANSLKKDVKWYNAHKEANMRGSKNPIFTGALAKYNGALLFEDPWMPLFSTGGAGGDLNYARAVLLGQGAGCYGQVEGTDYREDTQSSEADYGKSPSIAVFDKFGFKKNQIKYDGTNLQDLAVISMDTYYTTASGTAHA